MKIKGKTVAGLSSLMLLLTVAACSTANSEPAGLKAESTQAESQSDDPAEEVADEAEVAYSLRAKNADFTQGLEITQTLGELKKVKVSASYRDSTAEERPTTLKGELVDGKWTAIQTMEPNAVYTIRSKMISTEGSSRTVTHKISTRSLPLAKQTYATMNVSDGSTYGVGMPIRLTFDVPVTDKASFEENLNVAATPKQAGSWSWISDTQVEYRTKKYWKPGTVVSLDANLNSVPAGNGVYGQSAKSVRFSYSKTARVIKIDDASKTARVFFSGKLMRTIPISMGKPGFTTRSGVKVISEFHRIKQMRSETIGISGGSEYYDLNVEYALRLTNSGEFIHAAPWNASRFGYSNGSHGCTGMSTENAKWLYDNLMVGDVTEYTGTGRPMESWNGYGEWNLSWKTWKSGSALS